jgi:hypothetical protein
MKFPQFRRYTNHKSYFKVLAAHHFIEYKVEAKEIAIYEVEARTLPDRNLIEDMLYRPNPHWEVIDQGQFDEFIDQVS